MEAITTNTQAHAVDQTKQSWLKKMEQASEFNRFGIISVGFLLIGIVGGFTVGFFAREHLWQIAIIVASTMLAFSLMLAVAPMKLILRTTVLALAIDVFFMVLNSLA